MRLHRIFPFTLLVLCAGAWTARAEEAGKTIKIGLVSSVSGTSAALNNEQRHAVEMAVEDANQKGPVLAGTKLELVELDDQGQPQTALQVAREVEGATIVFVVCDRGDRYLSSGVFPA